MATYKVSNIDWDIDMDDIVDLFVNDLDISEAAKALNMKATDYVELDDNGVEGKVRDYFHHRPGALYDFLDLPENIIIDIDDDSDEDCVVEYLTNEYGYCINNLECEKVEIDI